MTMSLQNKLMRNWVAFNTCLKANLILYCKLQLNNVISFLAGKRRAEVTTDIADKGTQRFFITTPPPLPLSHFRMSGSWEKNENQILFGWKLVQKIITFITDSEFAGLEMFGWNHCSLVVR